MSLRGSTPSIHSSKNNSDQQQPKLEALIRSLEKLIATQEELLKVASEKTDAIIHNEIETLQTILKLENKYILMSQKLQAEITKFSCLYFEEKGIVDANPSLAEVIGIAPDDKKEELHQLKKDLEERIFDLQHRNHLNQDLLQQSLQILNITMDLIMPDIESFNYHPSEQEEQKGPHSIFDSKA